MPLRKEKLEDFKATIKVDLLAQRESLSRVLKQTAAELSDDDSGYTDAIDQASAIADKTMALQMKSRDRDILFRIDEALRRLEEGRFGDCERCSESISEARIKAFPFTTLCIDCKAELESEEHRFPGRH